MRDTDTGNCSLKLKCIDTEATTASLNKKTYPLCEEKERIIPNECIFCSGSVNLDSAKLSVDLVEVICHVLLLKTTDQFDWKESLYNSTICRNCHGIVSEAEKLLTLLQNIHNQLATVAKSLGTVILRGHINDNIETTDDVLPTPSQIRTELVFALKLGDVAEDNSEIEDEKPVVVELTSFDTEASEFYDRGNGKIVMISSNSSYTPDAQIEIQSTKKETFELEPDDPKFILLQDGQSESYNDISCSMIEDIDLIDDDSKSARVETENEIQPDMEVFSFTNRKHAPKFSESEIRILLTEYNLRNDMINSGGRYTGQLWDQISKSVSNVRNINRTAAQCRKKVKNLRTTKIGSAKFFQETSENEVIAAPSDDPTIVSLSSRNNKEELDGSNSSEGYIRMYCQEFSLAESRVLWKEYKIFELVLKTTLSPGRKRAIWYQIADVVSSFSGIERMPEDCMSKVTNIKENGIRYNSLGIGSVDKVGDDVSEHTNTQMIPRKQIHMTRKGFIDEGNEKIDTDNKVKDWIPSTWCEYDSDISTKYENKKNYSTTAKDLNQSQLIVKTWNGVVLLKHAELKLHRCDGPDKQKGIVQVFHKMKTWRVPKGRLRKLMNRLQRNKKILNRPLLVSSQLEKRRGRESMFKWFKCSQCYQKFKTEATLTFHVQIVHKLEEKEDKERLCELGKCQEKFKSASELESHIRNLHGDEIPRSYRCEVESCWRAFYTAESLEIHKVRAHDESARQFPCGLCSKIFYTPQGVKQHKKWAHEQGIHCQHCSKVFKQARDLSYHQTKAHQDMNSDKLNSDRQTCSVCGFRSHSPWYLKEHMKQHTGGHKFTCKEPNCKFRTDRPSRFKSHMSGHTGERNFQCHLCPKSYSRATALNYHISRHGGATPYKCQHCERSFANKKSLSNHVDVIHIPKTRITCESCGEEFPIRKYYNRHRRICAEGYSGTAKNSAPRYVEARRRRER